jgi:hypothetical protein
LEKDPREAKDRFARRFAQLVENDPELARLVEAWPTLPDAIRRAILALISAGAGG